MHGKCFINSQGFMGLNFTGPVVQDQKYVIALVSVNA